jgi:hypothetical protein
MSADRLVSVSVNLITSDALARPIYDNMKQVLTKKYGNPGGCLEKFLSPYYEGDGHAEDAIRLGKAKIACLWFDPEKATDTLAMMITGNLVVHISYDSPSWKKERERRIANGTKIF